MMGMESFKNANKPPLTPPDFLFPIVLTILLWLLIILMIIWVTFAAYFNIGIKKLRRIAEDNLGTVAVYCGNRFLIIRPKFEEFISGSSEI